MKPQRKYYKFVILDFLFLTLLQNPIKDKKGDKGTIYTVPQNYNFRITISLQPNNANLWYFNYRPVNLAEYNSWKSKPDCKNINFRKLQFEASVQFLLILKLFFFSTAVRVGEYDISNTIPDCDKYENFCAPLPQVYSGLLTAHSSGIQGSTRLPLPQVYSGLLDYPFLRYTVFYSTTPSSGI